MRIFTTDEERAELLHRLSEAPGTPEIKLAIRVIQEANDFANICTSVEKMFEAYDTPDKLEKIVKAGYTPHSMLPFCAIINELYDNIRLQRFKKFFIDGVEEEITFTKSHNPTETKKYALRKTPSQYRYDSEGCRIL